MRYSNRKTLLAFTLVLKASKVAASRELTTMFAFGTSDVCLKSTSDAWHKIPLNTVDLPTRKVLSHTLHMRNISGICAAFPAGWD
jgi:hypothetical protein